MRELERQPADTPPSCTPSVGVVGRGRVGRALALALRAAGYRVDGPAGRDEVPAGEAILLSVPDSEIAAAAATVAGAAPFIGHTSGATPLTALEPAGGQLFGLHPLQTFTDAGAHMAGCGCAVAGSTPAAVDLAARIACDLGMLPFEVGDDQRAAYHAAASIASNFLVTLQAEAEELAAAAGIDGFDARRLLGPLVRTTVENWLALGAHDALTGPISRGDEATVARQREAVAEARPEAVAMFDALADRTRALAAERVPA